MEVALGAAGLVEELAAAGVAGFGETVRLAVAEVFAGVAFASGVAAKLDSVVVGGVEASGFGAAFGSGCSGFVVVEVCLGAGDATREEMIAGSTVGIAAICGLAAAGALRPGGWYLLAEAVSGGKSCL